MSEQEAPRYRLVTTSAVRRQLAEAPPRGLPETVAVAVFEFISGSPLVAPRRVGKPLLAPFEGLWVARRGAYRVRYEIDDADGAVRVLDVDHRANAYHR